MGVNNICSSQTTCHRQMSNQKNDLASSNKTNQVTRLDKQLNLACEIIALQNHKITELTAKNQQLIGRLDLNG